MIDVPATLDFLRNHPGISEHLQVLGDGGAVQIELRCDIASGAGTVAEHFKDSPPDWVGNHAEDIGNWHGQYYMSENSDVSTAVQLDTAPEVHNA